MNRRQRAFTLIELLIVVAIISLMAFSLLPVITSPAYEQAYASSDAAFEAGSATFFSQIVAEMHSAADVRATSGTLEITSHSGRSIRYHIDTSHNLRRRERGKYETALINGIEEFTVAPAQYGLYSVRIVARLRGPARNDVITREMKITSTGRWTGEAQS